MSERELKTQYFFNTAFVSELLFFTVTQLFALYITNRIDRVVVPASSAEARGLSPIIFVLVFILTTATIYLLLKKLRSPKILAAIFYIALIHGLYFTFSHIYNEKVALFATFFILLFYFLNYTILAHNILLTFALSGIGVLLASMFTIQSAVIMISLLAIYDYYAVNKSGHMILMFKRLMTMHVPFAMIFPYEKKNFKNSVRLVEVDSNYVFLGTGDLIVPMILTIPVYVNNPQHGLYVMAGSIFGVIMLYLQFLYRTERRALPGLPPIVFGALLGYLLWFVAA